MKASGDGSSAGIRDALRKVEYSSIMGGTISFDEGHQARNNAVVTAFKGGKIVIVGLSPG